VLVDYGNQHLVTADENYLVVPADSSWYVVQQYKNAIFVDEYSMCCAISWHSHDNGSYLMLDNILLVVLILPMTAKQCVYVA
jgi:hypothetical protein